MDNPEDFSTFDNQFYPSPRRLAVRAFNKFKEKKISRLLEPQAGRGDLADVVTDEHYRDGKPMVECIEIDLSNQAILRSKGYRVVGTDFLRYKGASVYSHILMNPPFAQGPKHVLHAWELLFSGEIVAIVNAVAIKNPSTAERRQLVRLIQDHGSVEFIQQAFTTEDTKRTTQVEIALVHLQKTSTTYTSFIEGLRNEVENKHEPAPHSGSEVIVPRDFIENQVINFKCAVEAAKQACVAQSRANYYSARFDMSIAAEERDGPDPSRFDSSSFNKVYDCLKERAWSTILRSTSVLEKLSSQAQKRIEADFKELCALEFSYENIWGFLDGLISQQGQIQIDMVCDVFDAFSKHHSDNRAYYQGWKSNTRHRLNAFRVKTTRIVLPADRRDWYSSFSRSLSWDDEQRFRDFDKVFAMLDGKRPETTCGLCDTFHQHWNQLRVGTRVSSDYFDVRMYAKAGTFHLYPRRKDLIERMNRVVGEARKWLPHDKAAAPAGFWQQYEQAEKITAKLPNLVELERAQTWGSDDEKERAAAKFLLAHQGVLGELGITYHHSMLLEHERAQRPKHPALPAPSDQDEAA